MIVAAPLVHYPEAETQFLRCRETKACKHAQSRCIKRSQIYSVFLLFKSLILSISRLTELLQKCIISHCHCLRQLLQPQLEFVVCRLDQQMDVVRLCQVNKFQVEPVNWSISPRPMAQRDNTLSIFRLVTLKLRRHH